jgi:hypothetical protein
MNPTPSRPDNTPPGAGASPHSAAVRARINELAAQIVPEMEQPIAAFAARLPDTLLDEFLQLILGLDSLILTREMDRENIVWEALTAHLPGMAPMLEVLRAHLQEDVKPACVVTSVSRDQAGQPHTRDYCRIAHESGYASYPAGDSLDEGFRAMPPPRDDDSGDLTKKNGYHP